MSGATQELFAEYPLLEDIFRPTNPMSHASDEPRARFSDEDFDAIVVAAKTVLVKERGLCPPADTHDAFFIRIREGGAWGTASTPAGAAATKPKRGAPMQ